MTRFKHVLAAVLLTATAGIGTLLPFSAQASENGRRNTTYGLGALTGALIYKHQWIPAAVSGIGTYAAYHNWQAQVNARHRYQNHLARLNSYRSGYGYGARQASWHHRYVSRWHEHEVRWHERYAASQWHEHEVRLHERQASWYAHEARLHAHEARWHERYVSSYHPVYVTHYVTRYTSRSYGRVVPRHYYTTSHRYSRVVTHPHYRVVTRRYSRVVTHSHYRSSNHTRRHCR